MAGFLGRDEAAELRTMKEGRGKALQVEAT